MMSACVEPRAWPARRWWTVIGVVFALHLLLLFWLEDRSTKAPRPLTATPAFHLSNRQMDEWLALKDPTLFALPHRQGFSGEAWLTGHTPAFRPADWSEPARCLPLDVQQLGACFGNFVQTNAPPSFSNIPAREPIWLTAPGSFSIAPPPSPSRLRMEGDLAKRRLLSPLPLPSWTSPDLLTNSVVQLLVDAQGNTVSAVLLTPGSGSRQAEADQRALDLARAARFEALAAGPARVKSPSAGLSVGRMIFEWQTLPASSTNALPAAP